MTIGGLPAATRVLGCGRPRVLAELLGDGWFELTVGDPGVPDPLTLPWLERLDFFFS